MAGAHPVFMGPDSYTIFGAFFLRIGLQNNEYKIGYESEYLFGVRKETTTNY
jgi:hypothetical protein